jgi:thioredoxin-like negative regulator of GroEL
MYRRLDGTKGAAPALTVRGPSEIAPQAAPRTSNVWLIAPEKSAALVAGKYVFTAGDVRADVVIKDEPAELSAGEQEAKRIALASHALSLGDAKEAERVARAWIEASPKSALAHEALGDALAAAGKTDDALKAYNEAILRTPPSDLPPRGLHAKVAALRQKAITGKAPGAAPAETSPAPR